MWAIEVKRSLNPKVERGFHSAVTDLQPKRQIVVYPGELPLRVSEKIEALPLHVLGQQIAG